MGSGNGGVCVCVCFGGEGAIRGDLALESLVVGWVHVCVGVGPMCFVGLGHTSVVCWYLIWLGSSVQYPLKKAFSICTACAESSKKRILICRVGWSVVLQYRIVSSQERLLRV